LDACRLSPPDLVILDIHLPGLDGFEVARYLHANEQTVNIPIIFLTERVEHLNQLQWLELGTDDYMAKPFDIQELSNKVTRVLERPGNTTGKNAVTGLPDGIQADERLASLLAIEDTTCLRIKLENLDTFTKTYGLPNANNALKTLGNLIQDSVRTLEGEDNFLAHLSANVFVLIVQRGKAVQFEREIKTRLEPALIYFYPIKDRELKISAGKRLAVRVEKLNLDPKKFTTPGALKEALLAG
jgi:PleD family two-component response regulator